MHDVQSVTEAVEWAKSGRPELDAALVDFLHDLLLLRVCADVESELVMRFHQLTGPTMAKGLEDTVCYSFNRLVSLNELGGDPGHLGVSPAAFHQGCLEAQQRWPQVMLATSTHDTKRSEDVRVRIHLLSEIPARWAEAVRRWAVLNERHRRGGWPDRNTEYLLYQTLVGAWPLEVERALTYMEKAICEAKVHTSWTHTNADYEEAVRGFVTDVLADPEFTADLATFVASLVQAGRVNALAQTLLKLTAPGVPDLYQGTEVWNLSLVDPDNRRPVDYDLRRRLLHELEGATPEQMWARVDEGLPKLWLIRQALALRRRQPELFGPQGDYQPLLAKGERAAHVVAFMRGKGVVTVVPRLVLGLNGDWGNTTLKMPDGSWRNELTGDDVDGHVTRMADCWRAFQSHYLYERKGCSMDFRLWAPKATTVEIALDNRRIPMMPCAGGWWTVDVAAAGPETEYTFILDDNPPLPDPRSSWQPHGVHGPSRVIDHQAFAWTDDRWQAGPLSAAVLYELHIGTFTPAGTFEAAIEHLDHLVELGITHVELMPVAEFSGMRGWGYDGVDLYAPHHAYGGPEGLKRLVDAAHSKGLSRDT